MAFHCSPVIKAEFDVTSIVFVWGGTLAITFGGIPALASVFLLGADGAQILGIDGALLIAPPDPTVVEAYHQYMRWAWFGMSLITLGALWQATVSSDIRNPSRDDTENPSTSATMMLRRVPVRVSP